jgi:hypothetical protein
MSVQLILKNSSVQDKAATAQQLEIGEIALNYHESGPFLQCKDTTGQVWRIGGVIVADEAPGQPQPGTWWFETDTNGLYFYDGTGWTEITGGGGGAGDITAVVAGEGLSGGGNSGTVTLDADLDLTKGLEFTVSGVPGSKIAIKPGANISFDTDGSLRADIASVSIKGTVDLTSATIPSPVTANDGYYNTVGGTLSAAWQAATGEGAITVYPGDTVVYNGTDWTYVPGSPGAVTSVFGRLGAVVATEGDYDLDQLGDVDLTSTPPVNNDVLQYNGSEWVPAAPTTAPVTSVFGRTGAITAAEGDYDLDELGDVDLTTTAPVTNDVLQYNGSAWVPVTGTSLGYWDRTGTVLSAANTGDQIQLTGALDVNDQPINTTVTDGDIDLDANGAGLIRVTEFNLSQVPIVTQHDIGTDANEVPLNGMLGGMAFQDPASVSVDDLTVAHDLTVNTDTLFVDASNDRVGIGTASPGTYLDIQTGGTGELFRFGPDGTTYADYSYASNTFTLAANNSKSLAFETGALERARITSDGYVRLASGSGGIQFNGDTAADNALDDYEEGTWTPVVTDGTTDGTMNANSTGTYVKVGSSVTCTAYVYASDLSALSGALSIKGLPFTNGLLNRNRTGVAIGQVDNVSLGGAYSLAAHIPPGGNILLYVNDSSTGSTTLQASEVTNTFILNIGFAYRIV